MEKKDLRIVFMGTPEFAVETLKALVENEYNVVAVVTQPDKAVGRHQTEVQPSEVKKYALEHNLPVLQPEKMKDPAFVELLKSYKANLQVVVAFRMLPEVVWDMPQYGTFNVHAALLPQYRGAAPINWAVINGETQTGVTTFFLDKDIDTGRVILQKPFDIPDEANVEYVYDGLMHLGAEICLETLEKIIAADGHPESILQEELEGKFKRLYEAPKLFKNICEIDWNRPCKRIYDFIRGLSPYPGAWTSLLGPNGKTVDLKIFKTTKTEKNVGMRPGTIVVYHGMLYITTGDYMLQIDELQMAGRERMKARDFLNGNKNIENYIIK
ncbi:MAG: methionyl-tRNA formyltransferase [Prevotella sp.]|nr:methionyl-tRNA formyltransferase [Prevotella sp.]